jgi:glycosyltransferase involved in cell wall biosynthesis
MKVAVVHYHLEPGGVTRVIENTLASFEQKAASIEFVVLTGRKYLGGKIRNVRIVDGLDYSSAKNSIDSSKLKERMEEAAIEALGEKPDIWHIHNHSLGKNPSLTKATSLIAETASPVLLHPHDFAEDGRPSNFCALKDVYPKAYPSSSNIHYAVLNHRDFSFMEGLLKNSASKVHLLANAIPPTQQCSQTKLHPSRLPNDFFLYPVRAVRRKNLGELALISSAYKDYFFANSLGPTNPDFTPTFNRWKHFSKSLNLPVTFGLGEAFDYPFEEIMNSASGVITTSIAEGFGLGFLEPWTFNKFLCGRNISEITKDFSNLGIQLGHMYDRININLDHLPSSSSLQPKIKSILTRFFSDYGQNLPDHAEIEAYNSIVKNGQLDFGRIDESMQEEIICSLIKSETTLKDIRDQVQIDCTNDQLITENKKAVREKFSLKSYTDKLENIYLNLVNAPKSKIIFADGKLLLQYFLRPERLNLLRTN